MIEENHCSSPCHLTMISQRKFHIETKLLEIINMDRNVRGTAEGN
jgi:hypothetical protein